MKLGVCSLTTPEYELPELLKLCAEIGYDGVSLRVKLDEGDRENPTFQKGNRATLSAEQILDSADDILALMEETGMEIPSFASYCDPADLDDISLTMKAAAAIGAKGIRVYSGWYDFDGPPYPEQVAKVKAEMPAVADLGAQHGVRANVEGHFRMLTPSMTKTMAVLEGLDPACVGIIWDPDNQVREGWEVLRMAVQIAGPYLAEVHVKNCRWELRENRQGEVVWMGRSCHVDEGHVDYAQLVDELKLAGFDGWLLFEDMTTDWTTEERLRHNHDYFRELLG